jgi:hypothetical protein
MLGVWTPPVTAQVMTTLPLMFFIDYPTFA